MNPLIIIILSVTQAVTEFLPISSSAHLLLLPWVFGFDNPGLAFDAALHIGTALALLVFFAKDFWKLIVNRDRLLLYIFAASVPAAFFGFFGDKFIEEYLHLSFYAPLVVGIGMVFFSIILYMIDRYAALKLEVKDITLKQSLVVGFAQALALIPGTSRSGVTITAGLWLGLKREDAARFSFLLATPISLGAGLYKAYDIFTDPSPAVSNIGLVFAIMLTFVVGLVVIKWMLSYLKKHSMLIFVIYRIIVGLGIISLWLIKR